ncbi:hypothetical protein BgAZ_107340 [Babesia gibsoni]|uniref:Uncharacterized protein n=1 Tax=Babesia gibsoni TaxID=33632 RepID=A0AAD8PGH4_BABGI|nr:hypothetical protein BgAZ_107340 [Babesia gibsoni]
MTKLTDTQKDVEKLKRLVEKFLGSDDDELVGMYGEYQQFKALLNGLLSTIAKYRIQLNSNDENNVIFGPKTRKVVEELVRHYDKVYEIDEEHLVERFQEVEMVNALLNNQTADSGDDEEDNEAISILDETKQDLLRIQRAKEMSKYATNKIEAKLNGIQDSDIAISDPFYAVQQVYRNDPAVSLEDIINDIYQDNGDVFLEVLQNAANLLTQISKYPDEIGQRLIRINHDKFNEDFIRYPHAVAILKYSRFKIKHSDDVKEHLKESNLNDLKDEYFLYLKEPDMFTEYSAWKEWIDFLGATSSILQEFIVQYKLLMRVMKQQGDTIVSKAFSLATQSVADVQ